MFNLLGDRESKNFRALSLYNKIIHNSMLHSEACRTAGAKVWQSSYYYSDS